MRKYCLFGDNFTFTSHTVVLYFTEYNCVVYIIQNTKSSLHKALFLPLLADVVVPAVGRIVFSVDLLQLLSIQKRSNLYRVLIMISLPYTDVG
jgi:hypothetical protein